MVKLKIVKGAALDQAEQSGQLSVPVFRINAIFGRIAFSCCSQPRSMRNQPHDRGFASAAAVKSH
jgi:hypothetical protein